MDNMHHLVKIDHVKPGRAREPIKQHPENGIIKKYSLDKVFRISNK
jgi:hypothetical protein